MLVFLHKMFQLFLTIVVSGLSEGSYLVTSITERCVSEVCGSFMARSCSRFVLQARIRALCTTVCGYWRVKKLHAMSLALHRNWFSLEQIRRILRNCEYGIAFLLVHGWQES